MEEVLSEETIRIVKSTAPAMKQVRVPSMDSISPSLPFSRTEPRKNSLGKETPYSETDHIISLISHDAARVPDLHEDVRDALRGTPVPGLHVPKGGPHGAARRVV